MIPGKKYDQDIFDTGHAFAATWGPHVEDDKLREHGYRLVARPPHSEALWEKKGMVLKQSEALERIGK